MFGESLCAYVAVYILYYTTRVMYVLIYYYNIGYRRSVQYITPVRRYLLRI